MPAARTTLSALAMTAPDAGPGRGGVLWSVQYLRALAAIGVIAFHALSGTGHDFPFGAVGIHLFFTISGFLMWTTTCRRPPDVARFLRGRLARIVPLYWLATAVTLALSAQFPGFFYQASLDPPHVVKSLLFIPQIGVDGGLFPVLYQGWTLQYEMFFYALFALALTQPLRRRTWVLAGILGPLAVAGIVLPHPANPALATYSDPICLEFLLGALAGKLCAERTIPAPVGALLLVGGVAALWLVYPALGAIRWLAWLAVGGSACAILAGAVALERARHVRQWRWLRFAGEASYAMYLFQELGFLIASMAADRWTIFAPVPAKAALGAVCAVATGCAVYAGIELPTRRALRRLRA